jgi:hypothetical protein
VKQLHNDAFPNSQSQKIIQKSAVSHAGELLHRRSPANIKETLMLKHMAQQSSFTKFEYVYPLLERFLLVVAVKNQPIRTNADFWKRENTIHITFTVHCSVNPIITSKL